VLVVDCVDVVAGMTTWDVAGWETNVSGNAS